MVCNYMYVCVFIFVVFTSHMFLICLPLIVFSLCRRNVTHHYAMSVLISDKRSPGVFILCFRNVTRYLTITELISLCLLLLLWISCKLMWWISCGVQSFVKLNMDKCLICSRFFLPHARKVQCAICTYLYHIKCISLDPENLSYIELNRSSWYCCDCITQIFSFNHIEHDELFISEVNSFDLELETIEALSAKLFNPFEINNDEIYYPLWDIDPDAHYFNELNADISQNCNYYYEHSFSSVIQNRFTSIIDLKVFSLCHINIRSQKANLKSFEIRLENLQFNFSIIGIIETWLNDYNCDVYSLNGYNFVEAHRSGRSGGGVGNFLVNDIPYQKRPHSRT